MRVSVKVTAVLVLCLLGGVATDSRAATADNIYWSDEFGIPEFYANLGSPEEITMYNGELIVAGAFKAFAGVRDVKIAAFNGASWRDLNVPGDETICDLKVWHGYLLALSSVAVYWYDGTTWETTPYQLGACLAIYEDTPYVGGRNHVSSWDGAGWISVFETPGDLPDASLNVTTMTVYDDRLVIASATTLDQVNNLVLAWDGSSIDTLAMFDSGDWIYDLGVYHGELIALGKYARIDNVDAYNIAAYDGTSWRALGEGLPSRGYRMVVFQDKIITSYSEQYDYVNPGPCMKTWDGTSWSYLSDDFMGGGTPLFADGGKLYLCGQYLDPLTGDTYHLLSYDGSVYDPLIGHDGMGPNGSAQINTLAEFQGDLVIGGAITEVGRTPVKNLARFDGTEWHNMNYNLQWNSTSTAVYGTAVYHDALYISGFHLFYAAPADTCPVMHLVGNQWQALDNNLRQDEYSYYAPVSNDLFVHDDELYVGGQRYILNDVAIGPLLKWDGSSISAVPVPDGLDVVNSFAEFEGDLIIGGFSVSEPSTHVYRRNGSEFEPMGSAFLPTESGHCASIQALTVYNGTLYAGGDFGVDTDPIRDIAVWSGTDWVSIGQSPNGYIIYDLVVHDDNLFVMGEFHSIGEEPYISIAKWNGASWQHLGTELSPRSTPYCFVECGLSYKDQLVIGGKFLSAGDNISSNLAVWTKSTIDCCVGLTGNIDGDPYDQVSLGDLTALIDHLFISLAELPCPAEANLDGDPVNISLGDLTALIDHLFISLGPTNPCP